MPEEYDSHKFRMGQYSIRGIREFAKAGKIPKEDVEWRMMNQGGMFSIDEDKAVENLRSDVLNKIDAGKGDEPVQFTAMLEKAGMFNFSGAKFIFFEELGIYCKHGLISPDYVQQRLSGNISNIETELMYRHNAVPAKLAQERMANGKTSKAERKMMYKRELLPADFAQQRILDGKADLDEMKLIYEHSLVDVDFINSRLKSNNICPTEIRLMYQSHLIDEKTAEDRIQQRNTTVIELRLIAEHYPSIAAKYRDIIDETQAAIDKFKEHLREVDSIGTDGIMDILPDKRLSLIDGIRRTIEICEASDKPFMVAVYGLPWDNKSNFMEELDRIIKSKNMKSHIFTGDFREHIFELIRNHPSEYNVNLFYCSTRRFPQLVSGSDPDTISRKVLGKGMDLKIGVYNPNKQGSFIYTDQYDLIVRNEPNPFGFP